jgi:hypothetical protein
MPWPTLDDVRRLARRKPPLGVISIYLRLDPGDRGGRWRTELSNGLSSVLERKDGLGHEAATALRATCERLGERFADHERSLPRAEVGFVEVAAKAGSESWWAGHVSAESSPAAFFDEQPLVAPLVCMLERGASRGVALISAERVRLLEWAPGHVEELESWEMSVFSDDWRERKAQRPSDPARSQAVSASGRDQFEERLEENRHRFLGECGRLVAGPAEARRWSQLIIFGAADHVREFRRGLNLPGVAIGPGGDADLISEPAGKLEVALADAAKALDAERDRELVERTLESARGGMRGAAGTQETEAALAEARVDTLVLDAGFAARCEQLVRRALDGGANVVAVTGKAAELLSSVDGSAALLRY